MPRLLPTTVKGKTFNSKRDAYGLVEKRASSSTRGHANPQLQSPLLSLPGEIRHLIYTYTFLADPNSCQPYPTDSFQFRPGNTHARKIETSLLRTCRTVFLEAYLLPIKVNEHILYGCETSHAPQNWQNYVTKRSKASQKLSRQQRQAVKNVRIFAQQFWLEDFNGRKGGWADFCRSWDPAVSQSQDQEAKSYWPKGARRTSRDSGKDHSRTQSLESLHLARQPSIPSQHTHNGPEHLTIAIRNSDWWYYLLGAASPLAIDPFRAGRQWKISGSESSDITDGKSHLAKCTSQRKHTPCDEGSWASHFVHLNLKTLALELETLKSKSTELNQVVLAAKEWRFQTRTQKILIPDLNRTKKWTWSRASEAAAVARSAPYPSNFLYSEFGAGNNSQRGEEYYVVKLTWKAVDPEDIAISAAQSTQDAAEVKGARPPLAAPNGSAPVPVAHPAAGTGPARAVGRDIIPSYWG